MTNNNASTTQSSWASLEKAMQNSVVQVIAQVAQFNWIEPYKIKDQYENRGSGFFIDDEGHIITDAHVIDEATVIWVHLPLLGKQPFFVDVVGFCPDRDLALLKVRDDDFVLLRRLVKIVYPLPLGDSDIVQRTDEILVLGYPLGHYSMKSTTGVVSGRESNSGYSFIQVTAPVNVGDSGGPLVNKKGEVVGITIATMKGAQSVGFAIPVNELKVILDDLYKQGLIRRESLGIQLNYATNELARFFKNPEPAGVYIGRVFKNSLLDKAGVQEGDMLYEFNGYRIDMFGDVTVPWSDDKVTLNDIAGRLKVGDQVTLVIYRQGKRLDLTLTFANTEPYPIRRMYPRYENIEYEVIGGMVVMHLVANHFAVLGMHAPYLIKYTKPEMRSEAVLVISHILPGSYAQQLRTLASGMIIAEVNGVAVTSLTGLRKALQKSVETDLITIKTEDHVFTALPLRKVLLDENRLAENFAYPISSVILELNKLLSEQK